MDGIFSTVFCVFGFLVLVGLVVLISAVRVVQEYERGVIFRLGRLVGPKGPGLFFIIPFVDRMMKVDLRVVTLDVPSQEAITRDNVTVKVNAVVYFRVLTPQDAIVQVEDYRRMNFWPTGRRSTNNCNKSSTSRLNRGASRSPWSRSKTLSCPKPCNELWPSKPRPSVRNGPRSSTPRASSKPRSNWPMRPGLFRVSQRRFSFGICKRSQKSRSRKTPHSCSPYLWNF
jgi:hypothetical protein